MTYYLTFRHWISKKKNITCYRGIVLHFITPIWPIRSLVNIQRLHVFSHVPGTCIKHDDVIKWKHFPRNWPFRRRSKKTSKLCIIGRWAVNSPGTVNSPHKWPVTRKMFPFDDVIMWNHTEHITAQCIVCGTVVVANHEIMNIFKWLSFFHSDHLG